MKYTTDMELQQLRATEAHIMQLLENETDEETRVLLMTKYLRTQNRRRELSEVPA